MARYNTLDELLEGTVGKEFRGMFMIDKNELEELQSLYSLLMEMKSQGKNKEE